jgi:hypothetical protein
MTEREVAHLVAAQGDHSTIALDLKTSTTEPSPSEGEATNE